MPRNYEQTARPFLPLRFIVGQPRDCLPAHLSSAVVRNSRFRPKYAPIIRQFDVIGATRPRGLLFPARIYMPSGKCQRIPGENGPR